MQAQTISIEPEIIQFGKQDKQSLKITNKTSNHLQNFFFCLYNAEKFEFSPDSFSLAPNEQKIIKVTLKLKTLKAVAKQFAYLKSSETSKRITILINNFQSPQPKPHDTQQVQQVNTLSSRDYRQAQNAAYNKIINQKQAYITRLQRQIRQIQGSGSRKANNSILELASARDLQIAEAKILTLQREKDTLLKQNALIHERFAEYKSLCENELKHTETLQQKLEAKNQQNENLYNQIRILEEKGNQFLHKISEKQALGRQLQSKLKQLQAINQRISQELKADNEKRVKNLQQKLQNQRLQYQQTFRNYQQKIKELQYLASNNQTNRSDLYEIQRQLNKLRAKLDQQRDSKQKLQAKYKKIQDLHQNQRIKTDLLIESVNERNQQLIRRNRQQQIIIEKLQIARQQDRQSQYLQVAVQSCKNENQLLKRNHADLQRAYTRNQQTSTNRIFNLQNQIDKKDKEIAQLRDLVKKTNQQREKIAQESHHEIINLRKDNLQLLQKLSKNNEVGKAEELKDQFQKQRVELNEIKRLKMQADLVIRQLQQQNKELQTKIHKYKKQAKTELKNINNTAMEELKRLHQQKKELTKKVADLTVSLQQSEHEKTRLKAQQTQIDILTKCDGRKIGIKDQRKQLEESRAQSNSHQMENIYQELGQLRQLESYIKNQQDRLSRILGLQCQYRADENSRSIFKSIKFFKEIENKIRQIREQAQMSAQTAKQLQFMRGRLTQLQVLRKQNKNQEQSISLKEKSHVNTEVLEFVRAQMKVQYKKLHDTIKFNEEKHNILKKKIYNQYRARIIAQMQKKDRHSITQIETTLERFIQGLSNLSHKEAVLSKEVKLKQASRKQAKNLREKMKEMEIIIQTKKNQCSRQPIRIWMPDNEIDWQDNIKLQAQLLTHDAQITSLKEQIELLIQQNKNTKENLKQCMNDLEEKDVQINKLRKQSILAADAYQTQLQKTRKQYEEQIANYIVNKGQNNSNKKEKKNKNWQKEKDVLSRDLQNKSQTIKNLKEKIKRYEQFIQNTSRSQVSEPKKRSAQQNRLHENVKELRENNRELRKENGQLKEVIKKLEVDLAKKSSYISSLKGQTQQQRIKIARREETQNDRLKQEIKALKEDIRKLKDECDKIKKRKDKEIGVLQDDINRIQNQSLILQKSFQSIIRALLDTARKVYSSLDIHLRKKGRRISQVPNFQAMMNQPAQVDALKIYQFFQEPLLLLEEE